MAWLAVHPWAQFFTGLLLGCWIGAMIATACILLLVGRRLQQLEAVNQILRAKLRTRGKPQRTGTGGSGPALVMPLRRSSTGRVARVN